MAGGEGLEVIYIQRIAKNKRAEAKTFLEHRETRTDVDRGRLGRELPFAVRKNDGVKKQREKNPQSDVMETKKKDQEY